MSCRTTKGGTLAHRLARAYSGLGDKTVQSLFHALKREGADVPAPTPEELEAWTVRMRTLISEAELSPAQIERSEHDLFMARSEAPDGGTFYSWNGIEARARQEAALRSVKGLVVDLSAPGSQMDSYEIGPDGRPAKVWYASYGSNLSKDRFLTYIQGGTPEGSATEHEGARDKGEPEEDVAIRYAGRMHFAASSGRWGGGGIAFMDNDTAGHALGRAYRITSEQFDDVVAQENGQAPGSLTVPMDTVFEKGSSQATYGLYGTLVHIGDYQGAPVFTFTGNFSARDALDASLAGKSRVRASNAPSDNYMRMIGSGLAETFEMDIEGQADYLRGCLGAGSISRSHIVNVLSTPADKVTKPARSSSTRAYPRTSISSRWNDEWPDYSSERGSYDTWWGDQISSRVAIPAGRSRFWPYDDVVDAEIVEDEDDYGPSRWWDDEEPLALARKECNFCGETGHKLRDCPHM